MRSLVFGFALSLTLASTVFSGGEIPFSFTSLGGPIPEPLSDTEDTEQGFGRFLQPMVSPQFPDGIPVILSLQLELNGLSHTYPDDLDIYLYSPFGGSVEIMTDRGGRFDLLNANLIFNDSAQNDFPPDFIPPDDSLIPSDVAFRPEGTLPGHGGGLNQLLGTSGGLGDWVLIVIDDSPRDSGFLTSWTLRGTTVPEPVTLSLLALGALTILRRRRA